MMRYRSQSVAYWYFAVAMVLMFMIDAALNVFFPKQKVA